MHRFLRSAPYSARSDFRIGVVLALAVICSAITLSVRGDPEQWRAEIDQLTAQDAQRPAPTGAVVFVGSSSIRMWATLAEDFPGVTVINRGFGGSQLEDSVFYFDRLVAPYRPRLVVLYAGDNDIASGKTAEDVLADFLAFREKVRALGTDTRLVYLSIKESPARAHLREEMRRANALVAEACAQDRLCAFADVSAVLQDERGEFRADLFEQDGLHVNRAGYAAWADVIREKVAP